MRGSGLGTAPSRGFTFVCVRLFSPHQGIVVRRRPACCRPAAARARRPREAGAAVCATCPRPLLLSERRSCTVRKQWGDGGAAGDQKEALRGEMHDCEHGQERCWRNQRRCQRSWPQGSGLPEAGKCSLARGLVGQPDAASAPPATASRRAPHQRAYGLQRLRPAPRSSARLTQWLPVIVAARQCSQIFVRNHTSGKQLLRSFAARASRGTATELFAGKKSRFRRMALTQPQHATGQATAEAHSRTGASWFSHASM